MTERLTFEMLTARHPDWREHAWAMTDLAMRWYDGPKMAVREPFLVLDDLYHVVTNAPGCAGIIGAPRSAEAT